MPVTRSQKDAPSRPSSRPVVTDRAEEPSGLEGVTSASASGSSATIWDNSSLGTISSETTSTVTTATTAASKKKEDAAEKKTTEKTPEQAPARRVRSSAATSKPTGVSRQARSTKTTSSSARRRELEAREELARLELKQAEAASKLARVRLEMTQREDDDSVDEDLEDRTAQVQNWIETSLREGSTREQPEQRGLPPPEEQQKVKPENNSTSKGATVEIQALTTALKEAFSAKGGQAAQPSYIHELPYFDGNSGEWLAFKVVYEDTAPMFSDVQNMARLRRAVKGNAREAIKSLLYSEASPKEVMEALKRRYGRPDALVLAELEKIKTATSTKE